jgi:hypothetical protein
MVLSEMSNAPDLMGEIRNCNSKLAIGPWKEPEPGHFLALLFLRLSQQELSSSIP